MSYALLGHDLHDVADKAKKWFSDHYGAKGFKREEALFELPLRPTWQASLNGSYYLLINVQPTPFSPTLHAVVNQSAQQGLPIHAWVVVGPNPTQQGFASELRQALNAGVGVIQIVEKGEPHIYHRPVPLSLFGMVRTDHKAVPKARREVVLDAEQTFLGGSPAQGCQAISQELEHISRRFGSLACANGWLKGPKNGGSLSTKYFEKTPWAKVLGELENRANIGFIAKKCPGFTKQLIVRTRALTEWRNEVSHKPATLAQLKARDAKLRSMFEVTRQLVMDWYRITKPLGLAK